VIDRNQCQSDQADLQASCLLEAAKRNCNRKRKRPGTKTNCQLVSDVIVTNLLGEHSFIDSRTELEIMRENKKFRKVMLQELRRQHSQLVLELGLSKHLPETDNDLGKGIDKYCRSLTDTRRISWQYCVGAIVWFIRNPKIPSRPEKPTPKH